MVFLKGHLGVTLLYSWMAWTGPNPVPFAMYKNSDAKRDLNSSRGVFLRWRGCTWCVRCTFKWLLFIDRRNLGLLLCRTFLAFLVQPFVFHNLNPRLLLLLMVISYSAGGFHGGFGCHFLWQRQGSYGKFEPRPAKNLLKCPLTIWKIYVWKKNEGGSNILLEDNSAGQAHPLQGLRFKDAKCSKCVVFVFLLNAPFVWSSLLVASVGVFTCFLVFGFSSIFGLFFKFIGSLVFWN